MLMQAMSKTGGARRCIPFCLAVAVALGLWAVPSLADARQSPLPLPQTVDTPETFPEEGAPQGLAPPQAGAERSYLTPADFRALFEGRTIIVTYNGQYYGSEQYFSGDRSLWTLRGGECEAGVWTYNDPLFCFNYGLGITSCWRIFESGGDYFAEGVDGMLLRIAEIHNEPLRCTPLPVS
ncbi:MAG: hypothetical protein KTR21_02060 [Rhodobacteraceae bacterium]|nr:hypothetical protein [Paracoccaceae bacterium]